MTKPYLLRDVADVTVVGGIADGNALIWSSGSGAFYPSGSSLSAADKAIIDRLNTLPTITKDPTGFTDPANVIETYDPVARTVTVSGSGSPAYWRGVPVDLFSSGSSWTSGSHANVNGVYYLGYNGSAADWSTSPWTFDQLQIAYAQYSGSAGNSFAIRECHGLALSYAAHEILHETIGAYRESGGTLTWSAGVAGRKPTVSTCVLHDEDNITTCGSAAGSNFTQMYLSGSTASTTSFLTAQTEIVQTSGSAPNYNSLTGSTWGQTAITAANPYTSVWLIAIPVTASTQSQKFRFVWMQGQSAGTLASQQALTPATLNLGNFSALASEFVFLAQVILYYQAGNWSIHSSVNISGNHYSQVGSAAGTYLTQVNATYPLQGYGTSGSPLILAAATTGSAGSLSAADFTKLSQFNNQGYTLTVPASGSAALGTGTANRAAFWSGANTLTYDDSFVWDNTNKRLGIGTASPGTALDIGVPVATSSSKIIRIAAASGGSPWGGGMEGGLDAVGNAFVKIHTYQGAYDYTILYGAANGNVGIGTTAPLVACDIRGQIRTTGWAYINNAGTIATAGVGDSRAALILGASDNKEAWFIGAESDTTRANTNLIFYSWLAANGNVLKLFQNGNVLVSTLAGSGDQAVYAHNDGTLYRFTSDARLKTNIETISGALEIVKRLRGVRFNWRDKQWGDSKDIGLIAQEVQPIVPEVIGANSDGMLSVDYQKLVAVLIEAVQEIAIKVGL